METTFAASFNVCENIVRLRLLWDNGCLPIDEKNRVKSERFSKNDPDVCISDFLF